MNGQHIYNGCCALQIDFSKLQSLNVKYNNDKSRDYTNPILPSSENSNEPISIGARYLSGVSNVYGSPIMTLAGAPLTTFSAMSNGAIHFPSKHTVALKHIDATLELSSSVNSSDAQCKSTGSAIHDSVNMSHQRTITVSHLIIRPATTTTTACCGDDESLHFPIGIRRGMCQRC